MANPNGDNNDIKIPTNSDNCDATVDFSSDQFDPLKALYATDLVPPVRDARTYDNLAMYTSAQQRGTPTRRPVAAPPREPAEPIQRRWLPHQLPIKNERKFLQKNIFSKMEKVRGPLKMLKKCRDERIQVKVQIRHSHGIRGHCIGFPIMFDKHWNLLLEDVTEIWIRLKKQKVPALGEKEPGQISAKNRNFPKPPTVEVIESDKKTETCRRHIDTLLVRGEQVALVVILNPTDNSG